MNSKATTTKTTKTTRYLACLLVGLVLGHSAQCQEINFKDLARTGIPVVKRFTVEGVERDGREYLAKFDGVDTDRVNEARSRASSYSSSGSSSGGGNWRCEFRCLAAMFTGTGNKYTLSTSASGDTAAWESVKKRANETCQADKRGNGQWADQLGLCKSK